MPKILKRVGEITLSLKLWECHHQKQRQKQENELPNYKEELRKEKLT